MAGPYGWCEICYKTDGYGWNESHETDSHNEEIWDEKDYFTAAEAAAYDYQEPNRA